MNTSVSSHKTNTKKRAAGSNRSSGDELKTEGPLSEKDEVKKAEEKTKKQQKK